MRKNSVTMKEALEDMVNKFKLRRGINESRVKDNWARIMGSMIANHTNTISLKHGKLYLKVDSAALKHELTYSKDKIKELFNKEFGETVITDVLIF